MIDQEFHELRPGQRRALSERNISGIMYNANRIAQSVGDGNQPSREALIARNMLHLLDLKRAGHCAADTEHRIPPTYHDRQRDFPHA